MFLLLYFVNVSYFLFISAAKSAFAKKIEELFLEITDGIHLQNHQTPPSSTADAVESTSSYLRGGVENE